MNDSSFGKLFSCPVDGAIYAQPLWVPHRKVDGKRRNVVFVATAHDSLYAFDADASACVRLWKDDLIGRGHGGDGGETTVPAGANLHLVGKGDGDMTPEVGVTGTPVIDPKTDTLFVVSKSVIYSAGRHFYLRLHAIDVASGAERPGSPVTIRASFVGDDGVRVRFDPRTENQRAGLALAHGTVYVSFGSHEDGMPYVYGLEPGRAGRAYQVIARSGARDPFRQATASPPVSRQRSSQPAAIPHSTPTNPHGTAANAPATLTPREAQQMALSRLRRRSSPRDTTAAVRNPLTSFSQPETSTTAIRALLRS